MPGAFQRLSGAMPGASSAAQAPASRARCRRRPPRSGHRRRRGRAGQGAALNPHRRAWRQQPKRDLADLPRRRASGLRAEQFSGASRDRTDDLRHAMAALSQLSYSPKGLHPSERPSSTASRRARPRARSTGSVALPIAAGNIASIGSRAALASASLDCSAH
jgi:hypothetical protein